MNQTQQDVAAEAINNAIRLAQTQLRNAQREVDEKAAALAKVVAIRNDAQAYLDAVSEGIDEE